MDKKTYIQISIVLVIFAIISFVYIDYFRNSNSDIVKNDLEIKSVNIVKGSDDLITEMSYFSEDNNGNSYEIKSEYGVINPDKSNLILMDKVNAVVNLLNGEKIFIGSDKAEYNDLNNDTTFSGSVKMKYMEHEINSVHMDLSFKDQTAVLYRNVEYKSSLSFLNADRVVVDFLNKNTKIEMNDENKNILVRSIINNGNN